jgi:diacylglycerol kinase (ATP)
VIINPRAGRGNGKGVALAERIARKDTISKFVLDDFRMLEPVLKQFAKDGVTDLFISSGDGTVQAIQTLLAEQKIFATLPRICLLPHGTTNMTAADLGFHDRSISRQSRFIEAGIPRDVRKRATVRALNPKDGKPRHGMFLGTGAVAEATRYCQRVFNDKGVKGSFATFATLGSAVFKTTFKAPDPTDKNRFDRPYAMSVRADGKHIGSGTQLLFICTTLEKLILGSRPFWGGKNGGLRGTLFPYPVPNVVRWLIPTLYGGETRKMPSGAISLSAQHFSVQSATEYVIDGEFFDGPAAGFLEIEQGPVFSYIVA